MHGDVGRCLDADPDFRAFGRHERDLDVVSDHDALTGFAAENEHGLPAPLPSEAIDASMMPLRHHYPPAYTGRAAKEPQVLWRGSQVAEAVWFTRGNDDQDGHGKAVVIGMKASSSRNRRSRAWLCAGLLAALVWLVMLPAGVASAQGSELRGTLGGRLRRSPGEQRLRSGLSEHNRIVAAGRSRIPGGHHPADGILDWVEPVERLGSAGPIQLGRNLGRSLRTVLVLRGRCRRGLDGSIRDDL